MNTRQNLIYDFLCIWREGESLRAIAYMGVVSVLTYILGILTGVLI